MGFVPKILFDVLAFLRWRAGLTAGEIIRRADGNTVTGGTRDRCIVIDTTRLSHSGSRRTASQSTPGLESHWFCRSDLNLKMSQ
jgi:hypothetical protein